MNSVRLPAWFARGNFILLLAYSTTFLVLPDGDALLAAPQAATNSKVELLATNLKQFEIPFSVSVNETDVVEVALQVSMDQGNTWQEYARRSPNAGSFPFTTSQDQEFHFAIQTINRNGQRRPATHSLKTELRIAVDTRKPKLEFEVRPDAAGRIVGVWTARDSNIDPCSLVVEYRNEGATDEKWYRVATQSCQKDVSDTYRDQLAWWPETTARNLKIRATIKDRAGNAVSAERSLLVPLVAGAIRQQANPANAASNSPPQPANQQVVPTQSTQIQTDYQRSGMPYALQEQRDPQSRMSPRYQNTPRFQTQVANASSRGEPVPQPPASPNRFANHVATPDAAGPAGQSRLRDLRNQQNNSAPQNPRAQNGQATQWRSRVQGSGSQTQQVTSSTQGSGAAHGVPSNVSNQNQFSQTQSFSQNGGNHLRPVGPPNPTRVASAPTGQARSGNNTTNVQQASTGTQRQLPSSHQDPPGTAQWVSSSTGTNQQPAAVPATALSSGPKVESLRRSARPSPSRRFQLDYDIDAIGPEGVKEVELWITRDAGRSWRRHAKDDDQRSPVNVEVDGEGIFGFRILVVSNEGLRARRPKNGDPADIWVNVDTTKPRAQITNVPFGRGQQAGRLLVQWQVSDINLRMRPVKLSYSPNPRGPWTTIEDGIRNEGQYAWKPGVDIPDKVYLQLEAKDVAGNAAVHRLDRPVDVSGLLPRGHIRGITPLKEPATDSNT